MFQWWLWALGNALSLSRVAPHPRIPGRPWWEGSVKLFPVRQVWVWADGRPPTPLPQVHVTPGLQGRLGSFPSWRGTGLTGHRPSPHSYRVSDEMHKDRPGAGGLSRSVRQTQYAPKVTGATLRDILPLTWERMVRGRGGTLGWWTQVAMVFLASEEWQPLEAKLTSPEVGTPCLGLNTSDPEGSWSEGPGRAEEGCSGQGGEGSEGRVTRA